MKTVLAGLVCGGLTFVVACGGAQPRRGGALPEPELAAVSPAPPSDDPGAGPVADRLSGPFAALGGPCPEAVPEGQRCGPNGRIAAVYANAYAIGHRSARAGLLHERHANDTKRAGVDVYWDSGLAWLQILECGSCASLVGWTFAGLPEEMSEGQRDELIRKLGLPANTPLRSRADWEEADWEAAFQRLSGGDDATAPAPESKPSPADKGETGSKPAKTKSKAEAEVGDATYD